MSIDLSHPPTTAGIFIAGTDTSAGKTHFSTLLLRALRARGVDAVGMKPFCCGDRADADMLLAASGPDADLALVNPVWLRVPAAPYAACLVENRALDVDTALEALKTLQQRHSFVVVEGIGGWRVPLTQDLCMSDFAASLNLPVLLVAANRLGALNHTQLTVDSIRAKAAHCAGVILNHTGAGEPDAATLTNRGVLEQILPVPVLGEVEFGAAELPQTLMTALQRAGAIPVG